MRRLNKYILIILLSIFTKSLDAQVPGYLGKRLILGTGTGIIPSFFYPKANGKNGFIFQPGIFAEYVLSEKWAIRANLSTVKSGAEEEKVRTYRYDNNEGYAYYNKLTTIHTNEIDFCLKKYNKLFAPIGSYWGFSFGRKYSNPENNQVIFESYRPDELPSTFEKTYAFKTEKMVHNFIGIENGLSRVINDRWVLNASISVRVSSYLFADMNSDDPPIKAADFLMKERLMILYAYRFDVKVGYLIF